MGDKWWFGDNLCQFDLLLSGSRIDMALKMWFFCLFYINLSLMGDAVYYEGYSLTSKS